MYLLLVEWDSIEAHIDGFRTSNKYQDWKRLLHRFYAPFPTVEHFTAVAQVDPYADPLSTIATEEHSTTA